MPRLPIQFPALLALLLLAADAAAGAPYVGVAPQGKPAAARSRVKNVCSGCHGIQGHAVSPSFPNLAGQNYNYLLKSLENFRSGAWKASPMKSLVKTIPPTSDDSHLKNLAAYFAGQTPERKEGQRFDQSLLSRGEGIFEHGIRDEKVPACAACHMQNGGGMAPMAVPRLAGQNAKYVDQQLAQFASGKRANSPHHIMRLVAGRLSKDQMHAVAAYVQALRPAQLPGAGPSTYAAYVQRAGQDPVPGVPPSAVSTSAGSDRSPQG